MKNEKKLRVLALDGSGVRGIVLARVLQELEERTHRRTHELFDFVIGNSAGALVAMALMTPDGHGRARLSAADLVQFYRDNASAMFKKSFFHFFKLWWGLRKPKYDRKYLDQVLATLLGDTPLSATLKPVAACTYSLDHATPRLWTTYDAQQHKHPDYRLCDLASAASATPTYFAPKTMTAREGATMHEVDAGPWVDQSCMAAISALKAMGISLPHPDVTLFSLDTTQVRLNKPLTKLKLPTAGIEQWVGKANLLDLIAGTIGTWHQDMGDIAYPSNYCLKVPVSIPFMASSMDDSSETYLTHLVKMTEAHISQHNASIIQMCSTLMS